MFDDIKHKVEELLNTRAVLPIKNLEAMIKEHQRFINEQKSIMQSLSSINDNEDDGTTEFRKCLQVLADRVGFLSRHKEELLDKNRKVAVANEQLKKELEEKEEMVKTFYAKHHLEKQANKEKISFGHLEVNEIDAFVLNSAGRYEAINRDCSNHYLSAESVALFTDNLPSRDSYIVGQIVHVEFGTAKQSLPAAARPEQGRKADQMDHLTPNPGTDRLTLNSGSITSNPYGLPVGCEYFLVTVAMLPDTSIHSPPTS